MEEVYRLSSQVAKSDATVLILGESGTGKELLAKGVHFNSLRKEQPFVTINCGSLPENLIESELFGYKKGAFTGAVNDKKGKFEFADGGTIFLDEIGELPLHLQVKLLRVLQDGMVDKVGEPAPVKVDVRVVAATNRDLEEEVAAGNFREDLYYRLCVVPIKLPPLRERLDDIPLLTEHFLKKYSEKSRVDRVRIDKKALKVLLKYLWPGNVRELENLAERTVVMSQTGLVTVDDLPEKIIANSGHGGDFIVELPDEGINLEKLERELLEKAYAKSGYNQSKTARFLGITRNTLLYRFEKYGIEKK
jgi:two-component system NtrC family response regulator